MSLNKLNAFFPTLADSISQNQFVKLTLSNRSDKKNDLKNVFVKPVSLKSGFQLSFVYRYPTKDITKNYPVEEALKLLREMMDKDFMKVDLFTIRNNFHLTRIKDGKTLLINKPSFIQSIPAVIHDRTKRYFVKPENNIYLRELRITTLAGKVKGDKQNKFRQINRYIEVVDSIVQTVSFPSSFRIADMGAGKGYLTFALYDYLVNLSGLKPDVIGVEMRQELVDDCNRIADLSGFERLSFKAGSIDTTEITDIDMLIALHACDIATDQAIYKGIRAEAKVIVCAPCCHKQIRKQIQPTNDLSAISKYGILEERQAEILTDTMRALILEACGYKTKVFEFVSTEHTPKNVMLVGIKSNIEKSVRDKKMEQLRNLKTLFGIGHHHLEKLLGIS